MKSFFPLILCLMLPLIMGAGSDSSGTASTENTYERYYKEGVRSQEKGKYQDAIHLYEKALKKNPEHADSLNNLGFSLRMLGKRYMDKAARAYERALLVDAEHEGALEYQGELYLWWGKLELANRNLLKLKELNSNEAITLQEKLDVIVEQAKKIN